MRAMTERIYLLANRACNLTRKESGAVAFEYVLILGGVSAAVMGAIVFANPTLMQVTLSGACQAIADVLSYDSNC